jgi:nitrate/TMAO reductase-like tetraheme cytochrome c subunit
MSRLLSSLFGLVLIVLWMTPVTVLAADTVCIECHAGQPGALGEPVAQWRTSVHAENGISCHDCHGGDPTDFAMAMSPEKGFLGAPDYSDVPEFCGRCHVGVADAYKSGAHGQAIDDGAAQCVVCHGNHAIQRANLDLINEDACSQCHSYERAALIRLSLVETDTLIAATEADLDRLYRLGFAVDEMEGSLFNQRNRFHSIFHGVDVEHVRQETADVQSEVGKVGSQVAAIDSTIGERKLWGSIVISLFIFAGVIFLLVRKAYEEDEQG